MKTLTFTLVTIALVFAVLYPIVTFIASSIVILQSALGA